MGEQFTVDPSAVFGRFAGDARRTRFWFRVLASFIGLALVLSIVISHGLSQWMSSFGNFKSISSLPYTMILVPLFWMIVFLPVFTKHRRRNRKHRAALSSASPDDFLRLCPWCTGNAFGETPCCRQFTRHWEPEDLNHAWQDYVVSGMKAFYTVRRGSKKRTGFRPISEQIISLIGAGEKHSWIYTHALFPFLLVLFIALSFLPGMGFIAFFVIFLTMGWLGVGMISLVLHKLPQGSRQLQCLECHYILDHAKHLSVCPECGCEVSSRSVHFGGASTNWTLKQIGWSCGGMIFFGLMFSKFSSISAGISSVMPTSVLTHFVDSYVIDETIWTELMSRPMSEVESDGLVDVLIESCSQDSRTRQSHPGIMAIKTGTWPVRLDQTQLDRVHGMSWQPVIELPDHIQAGEPFDVVFTGEDRPQILPGGTDMRIAYAGVSIDNVESGGRSAQTYRLFQLDSRFRSPDDLNTYRSTHTINAPGRHQLRITYWLFDATTTQPAPADWSTDGVLNTPAFSTWNKRFDIDLDIDVKE